MYNIGNPHADWMYKTLPEEGLNGRSIPYPRGRVIGGSSAINAMIYNRGQARDYDHWRQLGLPAGAGTTCCRSSSSTRTSAPGANAFHGAGGEVHVETQRMHWPILDDFVEAAAEAGINALPDLNTGDNEGIGPYHVTQSGGRRWTAARGFLKPVINRANLRLETGCLVEAVTFDGKRASGIRYRQNGAVHTVRCRGEVILAGGSIGSAQLLLLSGVGPGAQLQKFGIPVVLDKPGVGENLHDHLQVRTCFKVVGGKTLNQVFHSPWGRVGMACNYALFRRGPLSMAPSQLGMYLRSDPSRDCADLQFLLQALSLERLGAPPHKFPAFSITSCNVRPTSRGFLRLQSNDPAAPPAIKLNYLATDDDKRVTIGGIRIARKLAAQPALARYQPSEFLPGNPEADDATLLKQIGDIGSTIFHPVGTAKMGRPEDARTVVDERLRVIGLERLRVVDASVMPAITSGNTAAPTMMIAEKGARMILEDAPSS